MPAGVPMLPGISGALRWDHPPAAWSQSQTVLAISAGAQTDLFCDPHGGAPVLNAPRLLFDTAGDWLFSARVRVEFGAAFDAGVLCIWADERRWAKVCLEYSPQRQPMVVSVVTSGLSDDANGFAVAGDSVRLRIARRGGSYAFHAARAGEPWQLIRHFALADGAPVTAGLAVQSPTGAGCTAHFDDLAFAPGFLNDIRSGQ